jgi:hypothetical protein
MSHDNGTCDKQVQALTTRFDTTWASLSGSEAGRLRAGFGISHDVRAAAEPFVCAVHESSAPLHTR